MPSLLIVLEDRPREFHTLLIKGLARGTPKCRMSDDLIPRGDFSRLEACEGHILPAIAAKPQVEEWDGIEPFVSLLMVVIA